MKLWIDEDLSPSLVEVAHAHAHARGLERGGRLQRLCASRGRVAISSNEKARLPKSPRIARKSRASRAHSRIDTSPEIPALMRLLVPSALAGKTTHNR